MLPRGRGRASGTVAAPGDRGQARVDTVTVYKTDTLRTTTQLPARVDTLRVTNTVTRVDTVTLRRRRASFDCLAACTSVWPAE